MRLSRTTRLSAFVLAASVFSFVLLAQQRPVTPQGPPPETPKQSTLPQSPAAPQAQSFTGTIVQSGESLVLEDESSKTSYTLDNAEQAKLFVGKSVRLTGTVDPNTNMLRVQRIQLLPSTSSK